MAVSIINLSFCSEPVNLNCPCCGQLIFSLGEPQPSCEHLIFSADSVSNCWIWHHKQSVAPFEHALKQRYQQACVDGFYGSLADYYSFSKADTVATIAHATYTSKSAVMFSIATTDKGCGGMHNGTIHALFDFIPDPQLCQISTNTNQVIC